MTTAKESLFPEHKLLTPKEVAAIMGVNPRTVGRWARRRQIPHYRSPSGRILFRSEEIGPAIQAVQGEQIEAKGHSLGN